MDPSPPYLDRRQWQPSRCSTRTSGRRLFRDGQAVAHLPQDQYGQGACDSSSPKVQSYSERSRDATDAMLTRKLSGSRPHPGRRQSQYSWAHMDPSAHSLAFRGGAEVPDEEYEVQNLYTEDAQGGDTEMYRAANRYMLGAACVSRVQGPPTPRTPTTDEEQSYTGGSRTRLVQP